MKKILATTIALLAATSSSFAVEFGKSATLTVTYPSSQLLLEEPELRVKELLESDHILLHSGGMVSNEQLPLLQKKIIAASVGECKQGKMWPAGTHYNGSTKFMLDFICPVTIIYREDSK